MVKQLAPLYVPIDAILMAGEKLKTTITTLRDARNKINLKPKETISIYIETADVNSYEDFKAILIKQVNADSIAFNEKIEEPTVTLVIGNEKIYVKCAVEIDVDAQREKLLKDLNHYKGFLGSVMKKLSNDRFVQNAKPEIIELEKKKKQDAGEKIDLLENSLAALR